MRYEDALKRWGAQRLAASARPFSEVDESTVHVEIEFEEGWSDPDPGSYGSFDYSGHAWVEISGRDTAGKQLSPVQIDKYEFDFAKILGEIVAAGDGAVTS
jgi:hypothetical protein